jgi:subtilase family serine protease
LSQSDHASLETADESHIATNSRPKQGVFMRLLCELSIRCVRRVVRPLQSAALLSAFAFLFIPLAQIKAQSASSQPDTPRIVSHVDNSVLTTIPGSTHPAALHGIDNGRLASTELMTDLILVLSPSAAQQAALQSFNAQQYDPNSPQYHQWLTPAQFGTTYGVSETDIETVTNWLQNQGFTIDEIPPSHTSIRFSGNVAQVENAFHTEMHSITSNGVAHIANTSDISIPTALTPVVVGVKSLHNFFAKPLHHALSATGGKSPGPSAPSAMSTDPGGARTSYAPGDGYQLLVPYDLATIYNYKSLWTAAKPINGLGQTVAIAGTSNIVLSDVATFRSATGLPANAPKVIVTNTDPGTTNLLDDRFENTLDVEWSGAAAPSASIVLVTSSQTSQTTDALYASESYIINNNVAKIMSVSYGECELGMGTAGNQEYNNLWQQAYTQGIAVFVSSGDSAAAVCDDGDYNSATDYAAEFGLSISGMTSTPYNVSVGGTDFNSTSSNWSSTNNSTNMSNATGYIPEVPWNDTITNPIVIASFNGQLGVNYSAEQWANYLLKNYGINNSEYQELIPPTGGSGGVSNCTTSNGSTPSSCSGGYAKPSWQAGVTGILSSDKRTVPDVSLFASNGFLGVTYLICDTQPPGFSSPIACSYPANALDMAVGGTSVSSPIMAGIMALINQKAGVSQGNPNPVLYSLAAKQSWSGCSAEIAGSSNSCYFNDVDTGTIAPPCYGGTTNCTPQISGDALGVMPGYAATAGYDKATGLGSLNVANVVNGWPGSTTSSPAATLSATSLTFASTAINASSATQTVTLTNSGAASMTVSGVSITGTNPTSFTQTNTCGATLAANASCAVTVTFKPAAAGALTATLNFADNAANSPQTVALSGAVAGVVSISITPSSLTFPSTPINTASASQTVTFTNTGTSAVTFTGSPSTTGIYNILFKGATSCGGNETLAAGSSCVVTFTFNPTAAGTFSATLNFYDTAPNSPQTITLTGTGAGAPAVSLSPTSLTFASTNVGSTSAAQTVTLKNTGGSALTISGVSITGSSASSYAQSNNCGTSLAASASCAISITFKPAAAGAAPASLSIADSASTTAQTVALTGTGAGVPVASFSPTSLTFASTLVGSQTAAQSVTLKNTGTAALTISSLSITGSYAASFVQTNTCGTSLAISASCTISVTFKPTAGGSLSASLNLAGNATNSPQSVALTGTGVVPVPVVTLSTTALSFPVTVVNPSPGYAYSPAQAVNLTNSGTAALNLTSITLGGTNPTSFTEINNCPASLAVSATCTILTRFAPTALGSRSATLVFTSNASPTTQSITLAGTGVSVATLTLSASTLSFGTVTPGTISATQTVTVTNNSTTTPINLTSFALSGTGAASFVAVNNCGTTLATSSSCIVLVEFTPTTASATTATLTVTANNPTATATVALSGQ